MKFKVTRLYMQVGSLLARGDLTLANEAGQVCRIEGSINRVQVDVKITDHEGATHVIEKKTSEGLNWEMPGEALTLSHSPLESISVRNGWEAEVPLTRTRKSTKKKASKV